MMGCFGRSEVYHFANLVEGNTIPMKAPTPKNEKKRLEVLWQYDVLDTVPEQVFDDLTELAASICEAPIAMITLVDEKRQWFKS